MKRWKGRIRFKGWFWARIARLAGKAKRWVGRFSKRHRRVCTLAVIVVVIVLAACGLYGTVEMLKNLAAVGEIAEGTTKLVGKAAEAEEKVEEAEGAAVGGG